MQNCTRFLGSLILLSVAGCHGGHRPVHFTFEDVPKRDTIVALRIPLYNSQQVQVLEEFRSVSKENADLGTVILAADRVLESGFPSMIVSMAQASAWWTGTHQAGAEVLASRLLANPEVAARWVGLRIARKAGLRDIVRTGLRDNVRTLLVKPEPFPWWQTEWWRDAVWFGRLDQAGIVAELRAEIIELMSEYGISEAIPMLRLIANDPNEWMPRVKDAARDALATFHPGTIATTHPGH